MRRRPQARLLARTAVRPRDQQSRRPQGSEEQRGLIFAAVARGYTVMLAPTLLGDYFATLPGRSFGLVEVRLRVGLRRDLDSVLRVHRALELLMARPSPSPS